MNTPEQMNKNNDTTLTELQDKYLRETEEAKQKTEMHAQMGKLGVSPQQMHMYRTAMENLPPEKDAMCLNPLDNCSTFVTSPSTSSKPFISKQFLTWKAQVQELLFLAENQAHNLSFWINNYKGLSLMPEPASFLTELLEQETSSEKLYFNQNKTYSAVFDLKIESWDDTTPLQVNVENKKFVTREIPFNSRFWAKKLETLPNYVIDEAKRLEKMKETESNLRFLKIFRNKLHQKRKEEIQNLEHWLENIHQTEELYKKRYDSMQALDFEIKKVLELFIAEGYTSA